MSKLYDFKAFLTIRADSAEEAQRIANDYNGVHIDGIGDVGVSLDNGSPPEEHDDWDDDDA